MTDFVSDMISHCSNPPSYLLDKDPLGVLLDGEQEVKPRPRFVVVLERGQQQAQVVQVLDVLLFRTLYYTMEVY